MANHPSPNHYIERADVIYMQSTQHSYSNKTEARLYISQIGHLQTQLRQLRSEVVMTEKMIRSEGVNKRKQESPSLMGLVGIFSKKAARSDRHYQTGIRRGSIGNEGVVIAKYDSVKNHIDQLILTLDRLKLSARQWITTHP